HENDDSPALPQQEIVKQKVRNQKPLCVKSNSTKDTQSVKNTIPHFPIPSTLPSIKTYERRYSCKSCTFLTHSSKAYFKHRQEQHNEILIITECPHCDYASQYPGKVKKHLHEAHRFVDSKNGGLSVPFVSVSKTENGSASKRKSRTSLPITTPFLSKNKNDNAIAHAVKLSLHHLSPSPSVSTRKSVPLNGVFIKQKQLDTPDYRSKSTSVWISDCPYCTFTSHDQQIYREHVLNHLRDKNFRCLICNRLYRHRGDCSFHLRHKHAEYSDRSNGDNLRDYVVDFHPQTMTFSQIKDLLNQSPLTSLEQIQATIIASTRIQPHASMYKCGYCQFQSQNSGDVKKHQTWKHCQLASNILPVFNTPSTATEQSITMSLKRKRENSENSNNDVNNEIIKRKTQSPSNQQQDQISTIMDNPSFIRTNVNGSASSAKDSNHNGNGTSHSPINYECEMCPFHTTNPERFNAHLVVHRTGARVYKCLYCDRLGHYKWVIERHIKTKHKFEKIVRAIEIDVKPLQQQQIPSSSSAAVTDQPMKTFRCSACSLQSYHSWVVLRHIRHFHNLESAHIIDSFNQTVNGVENSSYDQNGIQLDNAGENDLSDEDDNEEMLRKLIKTAVSTRNHNQNHQSPPKSINDPLSALFANTSGDTTHNLSTSLQTLLGQLTNGSSCSISTSEQSNNKSIVKRYKCSLCDHASAWCGNVRKHLRRMHPGVTNGQVIDISQEQDSSSLSSTTASTTNGHRKQKIKGLLTKKAISTAEKLQNGNRSNNDDEVTKVCDDSISPSLSSSKKLKDIDNKTNDTDVKTTTASSSIQQQQQQQQQQNNQPPCLYSCSGCSYSTSNFQFLTRHVDLHLSDGGFQCSQCLYLSKWRASVRKHMISTHGSSFASLANTVEPLQVHKYEHAMIYVQSWILDGQTKDQNHFYCIYCPYETRSHEYFHQHELNHRENSSSTMICKFCSYNIDDNEQFLEHELLHTNYTRTLYQNSNDHDNENIT
ncbi:unnamed protein product, partial [Didymodactylos carnosus]